MCFCGDDDNDNNSNNNAYIVYVMLYSVWCIMVSCMASADESLNYYERIV